jgi:23S rRNA (cytidine1920-2'-O)/16S rRNA (cytidine1409-2'-O)-methyltransferase
MHDARPYVSRGGHKLAAALDAFAVDPAGLRCADLGCNVGGFTDCLLQRGARQVFAVDTGYGALAWTLRNDPRVIVHERTNALHVQPPKQVDLVVMDVSVTPQELIVPAAANWLDPAGPRTMISLCKPHFELARLQGKKPHRPLREEEYRLVEQTVRNQLEHLGFEVEQSIECPIRGKGGNTERLLLIRPSP